MSARRHAGKPPHQVSPGQVRLRCVTESTVEVQEVAHGPSVALTAELTGLFEAGDDSLDRALSDVTGSGEITETDTGIASDEHQHSCMAGENPHPAVC